MKLRVRIKNIITDRAAKKADIKLAANAGSSPGIMAKIRPIKVYSGYDGDGAIPRALLLATNSAEFPQYTDGAMDCIYTPNAPRKTTIGISRADILPSVPSSYAMASCAENFICSSVTVLSTSYISRNCEYISWSCSGFTR